MIIRIISLNHLHALQKLPLIFQFPHNLATVIADRTDCHDSPSTPATSNINNVLSLTICSHTAPCCISLVPSESVLIIYLEARLETYWLDINKVMSQCSACHNSKDNRLTRFPFLMIKFSQYVLRASDIQLILPQSNPDESI